MGSRRYFNTQQNVVQEESPRLVGNVTPQRLRDFCFFFICLNNVNKDLILSIKWLRFLIREKTHTLIYLEHRLISNRQGKPE